MVVGTHPCDFSLNAIGVRVFDGAEMINTSAKYGWERDLFNIGVQRSSALGHIFCIPSHLRFYVTCEVI